MKAVAVKKRKGWFRKEIPFHLMLLPAAIITFIFKYIPFVGITMAFEDYTPLKRLFDQKWVGLDNYKYLFSLPGFGSVIWNTIFIAVMKLVGNLIFPVLVALLLNEIRNIKFKKVTQTLLYLPHFLSWVIIGGLAYQLFSVNTGVVNALIQNLGGNAVNFLQEDTSWLITYIVIGAWQSMGWGTIIYLASITSVSPELYEAARVDGANRWQQMWSVTLPCIRSTIVILLIMQLGKIMGGSFERIMALMNYAATEYTTTIPVLVYQWGIQDMKFSQSTALGLFQSIIGLALVLGADFVAKRLGETGLV